MNLATGSSLNLLGTNASTLTVVLHLSPLDKTSLIKDSTIKKLIRSKNKGMRDSKLRIVASNSQGDSN